MQSLSFQQSHQLSNLMLLNKTLLNWAWQQMTFYMNNAQPKEKIKLFVYMRMSSKIFYTKTCFKIRNFLLLV